ncbi:hypothetical protein [Mycolicibacterium holsaticum]|uniref:hypothetical protein n=1 Tax=Mycolicibacterium holsaticum TaxID=152142 RepID=UPI003558EF39
MSLTDATSQIDDPITSDDISPDDPCAERSTDETGFGTTEVAPMPEDTQHDRPPNAARRVSLSVRTLITTAVIVGLAATAGMMAWLYFGARAQLDAQAAQAAATQRAEEVAIDYAVNAAEMDYQDFAAWKVKLVEGTSPELKDKLSKAADSMEQVLAPLQWKSEARPLTAAVRTNTGGIYTVDAFVSVLTKTMQAPDGLQSTATYSITIDSRNNWRITDVGGIDAALGRK